MYDELLQFQRNDFWTLVPRPEGEYIINTKWIFCNKTDEEGNVIRNKARLVAQGYSLKAQKCIKTQDCLDPQIINYGSIDFTITNTKCEIE